MIYENSFTALKPTIDKALSNQLLFKDYRAISGIELSQVGCWKTPKEGTLKLNVDRVLFVDLRKIGLRAILRDSKGEVLMAASMKEHTDLKLELIKSIAIFQGLQLCLHMENTNFLVETDCQVVVHEV